MKYFVLILFFMLISCSPSVKNCKLSPDYEATAKSALENRDDLSKTELRAGKMACSFWINSRKR